MKVKDRLNNLGIDIPEAPEPVAEYIPAKKSGNLVFCSGQGPIKDGEYIHVGKVGKDVNLDEGYESARMCALNCLAAIKTVVETLDDIDEIVKVRGFVNSSPDFFEQPKVVNGASEVLVEIFGERGRHARAALGTSNLPDNIPVELEMVVKVK